MAVSVQLVPKMLSTADACAYLGGISPDLLGRLRKNGYIRPVLKTRYLLTELDELVEKLAKERDLTKDEKSDTDETDADLPTEGQPMATSDTDSSGTEGEGHGLRCVAGGRDTGRGDEGKGSAHVAERNAYPDLPGVR